MARLLDSIVTSIWRMAIILLVVGVFLAVLLVRLALRWTYAGVARVSSGFAVARHEGTRATQGNCGQQAHRH